MGKVKAEIYLFLLIKGLETNLFAKILAFFFSALENALAVYMHYSHNNNSNNK